MAGLQGIIGKIQEDAALAADIRINAAKEEAKGFLERAKETAKKESLAGERKLESELLDRKKRSASAAELKKRQGLLSKKQDFIRETINQAKAFVENMDDAAYFDAMIKLARKNAEAGQGEIIFSKKDLERMPVDFEVRLLESLKDKNAVLTVSKETREHGYGFVLSYGGIEENCSIDEIFAASYEEFSDTVQKILFG